MERHEQLGSSVGASAAGVVQSALGNLPELFIALFAMNKGLVNVVQAALVGSILANSLLVLGIALTVGGLKNGVQRFNGHRTRMVATLAALAATTMAIRRSHTPSTRRRRRTDDRSASSAPVSCSSCSR